MNVWLVGSEGERVPVVLVVVSWGWVEGTGSLEKNAVETADRGKRRSNSHEPGNRVRQFYCHLCG